ncbi:MAG TPA: phosphate acetyltransferase, partial [Ignavibacteria bacterium]|nr:phosphate acetyltransferase [Ignavibacteria bacterium]
MELSVLHKIKINASQNKRTIVLPESEDERVLRAAEILLNENLVSVITLGDEEKIRSDAENLKLKLNGLRIINPKTSDKLSDFTNIYFNLRKKKGITIEQARETIRQNLFFAAMMIKEGMADGSVAGSIAATGDVLRAGIQCVGMKPEISIVSSFFLMIFPDFNYSFADCAVVPDPDETQLADIAIATADNYKKLMGEEPNVALLSFSTKGSAKHESIDKVLSVLSIVKQKRPDLNVDGELQFDAAIIDSIGKRKAPGSNVAGKANVFIFP